ncbi:hypothetical protein [Streptomyces natalensis]|uniref:hypothetical protein n=1 Tax=Streptomyces natalensis TaxID=68242 RepID=UPI001F515C4F|nr:hypothetical protein [Streptomyces natalensis]
MDEAVVIIVVLVLAGALAGYGMPPAEVLSLLAGAGLVAVAVVGLWALPPRRVFHAVLRALPAVLLPAD